MYYYILIVISLFDLVTYKKNIFLKALKYYFICINNECNIQIVGLCLEQACDINFTVKGVQKV